MFKTISDILNNNNYLPKRKNSYQESKYFQDNQLSFLIILKNWSLFVGENIAKHSIPLKNTNKTLTILTDHPTWAQELSFMEEKIKNKIFKKFPSFKSEINRIIFQTNPSFFEKRRKAKSQPQKQQKKVKKIPIPTIHPLSPRYKALLKKANELFKEINDKELKKNLCSIYIQNMNKNNHT